MAGGGEDDDGLEGLITCQYKNQRQEGENKRTERRSPPRTTSANPESDDLGKLVFFL